MGTNLSHHTFFFLEKMLLICVCNVLQSLRPLSHSLFIGTLSACCALHVKGTRGKPRDCAAIRLQAEADHTSDVSWSQECNSTFPHAGLEDCDEVDLETSRREANLTVGLSQKLEEL